MQKDKNGVIVLPGVSYLDTMSKLVKVKRFESRRHRAEELPTLYGDYVALAHHLVRCYDSMYREAKCAADMEHVLSRAAYAMRQAKNVSFFLKCGNREKLQLDIYAADVVYIAGPMTGIADFNYPEFFRMENFLRNRFKCKVLNPARHDPGLPYNYYMNIAATDIGISTAVVLLTGYENSPGARRELEMAQSRKLKIYKQREVYHA